MHSDNAERMPGGVKLARTPMAASRLSLGGSPLHPSSPTLHPTALPITFQVQPCQRLSSAHLKLFFEGSILVTGHHAKLATSTGS